MFQWQYEIQRIFIVTAMVCVPWMAFAKPLRALLIRKRIHRIDRKRVENGDAEAGPPNTVAAAVSATQRTKHSNHVGEIFIHSGIQTIEFVLGSISHTASYLRLWALSLAHARLAEMLWDLVLCQAWHINADYCTGIFLSIIFAVWSILTIGILVLMEGLSAFLHTLRLHWIEFQSKFYHGQGYAFQPFSFNTISKQSSESLEA